MCIDIYIERPIVDLHGIRSVKVAAYCLGTG